MVMEGTGPRIAIVGNVVEDLTPGGEWMAAGPALSSARAAAALGAEVMLVSRVCPGHDCANFEGLAVTEVPAQRCPRFENRYENRYKAAGGRQQKLHALGEPIAFEDLPVPLEADAILAAPALDELAGFPPGDAPVLIDALQGPLRMAIPHRPIRRAPFPRERARPFLGEGVIAVFSDDDVDDPPALADALSGQGTVTVVTRGNRDAWLYRNRARQATPAISARVTDPAGAGDAFAAPFAVRLVETGDPLESCAFAFANARGSLVVERNGLNEMPSRDEVSARLLRGAA